MKHLFSLLLMIAILVVGTSFWAAGCSKGPKARTINLAILSQTLYGAGSGSIIRINRGDIVTFQVTTDEPMEIFLHGYDIEAWIKPGETGSIKFTADIPGFHPLMIHALGERSGGRRVEILLGTVNVLP